MQLIPINVGGRCNRDGLTPQKKLSISDGIKSWPLPKYHFGFSEISLQYVISDDFEREENMWLNKAKYFYMEEVLVKKTRFSPQHFGIHEDWPGQIFKAQEDNLHPDSTPE